MSGNEIEIIQTTEQALNIIEVQEQVIIQEVGARGIPGSQIFKGVGNPADSLGLVGDYYLDTRVYHLYGPKPGSGIWDLTSFVSFQGIDGKSFLTGTGVPLTSNGNYQDTYLDVASGNLYTKGYTGWNLQTNIINQNEVSYRHEQQSASNTWVINHNLGFKPNVNISDYGGNNVECDIEQVSTSEMILVFSDPVSGYAYLS